MTGDQGAPDRILIAGQDVASDLIGKWSFTEVLLLGLRGKRASSEEVAMVDAVLVALTDHGMTPSSLVARLVLDGAPESTSGAVAAGLLAVGSRFLGTVEEAGRMLAECVRQAGRKPRQQAADDAVEAYLRERRRVPGFGHNLHDQADPRVRPLLALAADLQLAGEHVVMLDAVAAALSARSRRRLIVNAAGAVAAILTDLGFSPEESRGIALVARCGGLLAHLSDERRNPLARDVWASLGRGES